MKKKLIALLLAIVTILSVCSVFAVTAFAAENVGNTITRTMKIRCANAETELCTLNKVDTTKAYSKIYVYKSGSEISYMNVWITNVEGNSTTNKVVSNKFKTYPDNKTYTIKYYSGITFVKSAPVRFAGSQPNVLVQKEAHFTAYSY